MLKTGQKPGRRNEKSRYGENLLAICALNDAHKRMMELYPDCYAPKNVSNEIARNTTFFSWNELLLWTGHFRADEIDRVRLMNCYDFMALVNEDKIRKLTDRVTNFKSFLYA